MKKLLSVLATVAFMGSAYAGTFKVGAQVNAGIKYKGGNTAVETMNYYVDGKDTKAFFIYNDEDVTGKLVLITPDQTVKVGVALLKIKKVLGTPAYMTLGKQPTFVDENDFSILGVSKISNSDFSTWAKVVGVSAGLDAGIADVKVLLVNDGNPDPNVTKLARVAEKLELSAKFVPVQGVKAGISYAVNLNTADDKEHLVYAVATLGKGVIPAPVTVGFQGAYNKRGDAHVYDVAAQVSGPSIKLVCKSGVPYAAVQYAHGNAPSGINYRFATKAGLKIKYSSNVIHNDYVKFVDESKTTTWEVGSDWVIKFAKTIK